MNYSIIIPVYNRPDELAELLDSIQNQVLPEEDSPDFEVIIVEDGSSQKSDGLVKKYQDSFPIQYIEQENQGPGPSRNHGAQLAQGDFFIFFDSDCILPPDYLVKLHQARENYRLDAFGGPDASHPNFSPLQKAINYAMTSLLSTGGIRGKKQHLGNYQARSFNMGFSRAVWEATGGFAAMRVSEDIDLSIRIRAAGFKLQLVEAAWVYHKRRSTLQDFYRQTFSFGKGRADISKKYPHLFKIVHVFPSLFFLFELSLFISPWLSASFFFLEISVLLLYLTLVLSDSIAQNKSLKVGLLSIITVLVQLSAYGSGFLLNYFKPSKQ